MFSGTRRHIERERQMSKFTDVQFIESSLPDENRVVDRIFATAHRSPERVIFLEVGVLAAGIGCRSALGDVS
jgi:hypothetical protein